jgi:hypothetical protein
MRTASILLALAVVLGFISEAGATQVEYIDYSCTVNAGRHTYGFQDCHIEQDGGFVSRSTIARLGPIGNLRVPFTATQGLVGLCLIVVTLIGLLVVLSLQWKRKQPAQK